ncbi:hypothetical protein BBM40_23585 [Vibrio parahaemolyticus]|uniref:hypothetical protein n=1 Tax=Vibrio TaxID=662 RepID=UPI00084B2280|nr:MULTISPECIES: hypothetical protein [Vibrio]MCU8500250.1 hypothetical protein [Vibrio vulnificus]EIK4763569.1 hypothetical protein [Vibrio parahaemolyticus]EJE4676945.1 hypothetical protein [Vibrio parahaemolyticus]EJG1573486.1 hypothetical protein [Vibrio parahaemolyticus]ODZ43130.1 hypothetical protein BBM40_23585 [Vibrio parahaemolyticus]
MSNVARKINESKLKKRVKLAREHASELDAHDIIENILSFIEQNPNHSYYSIVKLLEACGSTDLENLMTAVLYLSSKNIKIFSLQFCYFPKSSEDTIEISPETYFEAKKHGLPPVDKRGNELIDFDTNRLGFTCFIHSELRVDG